MSFLFVIFYSLNLDILREFLDNKTRFSIQFIISEDNSRISVLLIGVFYAILDEY